MSADLASVQSIVEVRRCETSLDADTIPSLLGGDPVGIDPCIGVAALNLKQPLAAGMDVKQNVIDAAT